ncbi:MAG: hypothetical protein QGG42_16910 [Phycisphaerae bacterium]|jgi:hypothetical protein|nr:hypothetical protein [Phycisphaerae bacterium]
MPRKVSVLIGIVVLVLSACWSGAQGQTKRVDTRLDAAEKFVAKSNRYLHHSALKRGMKGYGLTVMAGIKPIRFDAEIVSVVSKFGPHLDVILATLSGHKLEKTMIISGMSGSPVFMKDPKDGKFKMIGAVAYGWNGQNEPLCGIQPITQMLAAGGFISVEGKDTIGASKSVLPGRSAVAPKGFLKTALSVKKIDFASHSLSKMIPTNESTEATRLVPLSTPVMVSGMSSRGLTRARGMLKSLGMIALQGGGPGAAEAAAAKNAKLIPGGGIAIPMASGDADMTAVGTVTEVVGNKVMAFGHSFYSYGQVEMPMGPAYIHTIISGRNNSFKLGSSLNVTGTVTRDETSAIAGMIGRKPAMIPMKVQVEWSADKRKQAFNFKIAKHRMMTPMLVSMMVGDAAWGWRELPERHRVSYSLSVDFGKLGKYRASNVSSGSDVYWVTSDLDRAVFSMMRNPYGPRPDIKGIDVSMKIEPGEITAGIIDFRLDSDTYAPGDTLTGVLTLARPRKTRTTIPVEFKLPDDLPEGTHVLQVSDWSSAASADRREQPHKYSPKTTEQLLASMQRSVLLQGNVLYMRLPLKEGGGISLDKKELPDLPASKAAMITQARLLDTGSFSRSLLRQTKVDYVLDGSAVARFTVTKHRRQTPLTADAKR